MTIAEVLLADFTSEAENTRRVLERVPADKADWKPHDKSMKLGTLAAHVAGLAHFGYVILTTPQMNMQTDKFPKYVFTTPEEAVQIAVDAAAKVRDALGGMSDEQFQEHWKLLFGDMLIGDAPRLQLYRSMFFNHLIHHRGQLTVYLRLLDVKVPGIYGPSADEPFGG
ncbi:DinB family protein [Terriglobus roseus]|uniref:Uncharacterized damage-inducible protein DinB (Forms a four-helix bundle) n=1 Tax=Terriglobus roseus TaxID=392734 RepID=A0A1G7K418_9BACT|nr:DinB family protein [Terriglobus roseus]SDF31741.1 Uncharacterized damage-inducible protein DinB (forms a four-helix bundle) [Terriglobus roseus]